MADYGHDGTSPEMMERWDMAPPLLFFFYVRHFKMDFIRMTIVIALSTPHVDKLS